MFAEIFLELEKKNDFFCIERQKLKELVDEIDVAANMEHSGRFLQIWRTPGCFLLIRTTHGGFL